MRATGIGGGAGPGNRPELIVGTVPACGELPERYQLRTVQHVIESAVREVVREPVTIRGSSRTDSGVHARGQVASFACSAVEKDECNITVTPAPAQTLRGAGWPLSRGPERLLRALNGRLPADVQVVAVEAVPLEFDPSSDTLSKAYSYTLHASRARPQWDRRFVHQVFEPLDVDAMQRAAEMLEGEHDFASFAATGHGRLTTVRTVFACGVSEVRGEPVHGVPGQQGGVQPIAQAGLESAQRVRIDIVGSGFLWNMVRIIAGTLVEVGKARTRAEVIPQIIAACERRAAGPTLPPTGLCLEWIKFAERRKVSHDVSHEVGHDVDHDLGDDVSEDVRSSEE